MWHWASYSTSLGLSVFMFKSKNGTWLEAQMDIFPKKIYRWPRDTWKICSLSLIKKYKLKLQWSITSHQSEYVSFKSLQIILINVEERVEKKEPSYTVGGNVTGAAPVENSVQVSLKIKNRASVGSYNPAPGDLSGENSEFKICRHPMFIAALLTIAKTYSFPNFEPVCCSMSGSNCCLLTCMHVSQGDI